MSAQMRAKKEAGFEGSPLWMGWGFGFSFRV